MAEGWETSVAAPPTTDFFAWLGGQHNGLKPGQSTPAALAEAAAAAQAAQAAAKGKRRRRRRLLQARGR